MKNIVYLLFLSLGIVACKSNKKEKITDEVNEINSAMFSVEKANNTVEWTAYKTTDKVAVKGTFKKIEVTANGSGESVKEAIQNMGFSIPVSSIFSGDDSRDFKLRKFFFAAMDQTVNLTGKLSIQTDSTGVASISMNGQSKDVDFKYSIKDKVFSMNTVIDVLDWNAAAAIESLNEACKDLHKGADGVSKTWSEVNLNVTSEF